MYLGWAPKHLCLYSGVCYWTTEDHNCAQMYVKMLLNGLKRLVTYLHIQASAEKHKKTGIDSFVPHVSVCVCYERRKCVSS